MLKMQYYDYFLKIITIKEVFYEYQTIAQRLAI